MIHNSSTWIQVWKTSEINTGALKSIFVLDSLFLKTITSSTNYSILKLFILNEFDIS